MTILRIRYASRSNCATWQRLAGSALVTSNVHSARVQGLHHMPTSWRGGWTWRVTCCSSSRNCQSKKSRFEWDFLAEAISHQRFVGGRDSHRQTFRRLGRNSRRRWPMSASGPEASGLVTRQLGLNFSLSLLRHRSGKATVHAHTLSCNLHRGHRTCEMGRLARPLGQNWFTSSGLTHARPDRK